MMINDKVTYMGVVNSKQSSTGNFIYLRSVKRHDIIYGFAETEEVQSLILKRDEELNLIGKPGYSGSIIDHVLEELEIKSKYPIKYINILGARITRPLPSNTEVDLLIPVPAVIDEKKSEIIIFIKIGQQYKERSSSKILEVTSIIGSDFSAKVGLKLISPGSSLLKNHSVSNMTLRNLLSTYDLIS